DGEGNGGERHRTFSGNETGKVRRSLKGQSRHVGEIMARDKIRDAVDMASDDVAAKFVADLEGAFEIKPRALAPSAGRGNGQRLCGGIDRKPGAAIVDARGHHGKADPVAGDRGAVHDAGAVILAGDLQLPQVVRPGGDGAHLAYVGDDAGEHFTVSPRLRGSP